MRVLKNTLMKLAIEELGKEKGINKQINIEALEAALLKVAKNKYGQNMEIEASFNEELGEVELFSFRTVVENVVNRSREMSLEEARKKDQEAELGDSIGELSRISRIDQYSRFPVGDDLGEPPDTRCDDGQAAGHGFEHAVRDSLHARRRLEQNIDLREKDVGSVTKPMNLT